jgi:hypothetical protein
MKDNHITEILDNAPFASLSENELLAISAHTESCADCARALAAARISSLLVKERTSQIAENTLNANPFFQTRVVAAWREQQSTGAAWSLRRLWNAAGGLVASMAVTTAALVVFTFVAPATDSNATATAALLPPSAEALVLDQGTDDMTNDQVLNAIYNDEDEGK